MNDLLLMALEVGRYITVPVAQILLDTDEDEYFSCYFNRPPLNLSPLEWVDLLLELQARNFIRFYENGARYDLLGGPFTCTRSELLAAIRSPAVSHLIREDGSKLFSYGLTPKGGAFWEAGTEADWNRYLGSESTWGDDWISCFGDINREEEPFLEAEDTDEAVSDETANNDTSVNNDEWWREREHTLLSSMNRTLIKDSLAVDRDILKTVVPSSRLDGFVQPWHPTYWKTLPFAYRIGYTTYNREEQQTMNIPYKTEIEQFDVKGFHPDFFNSAFPPHEPSS